jgi:hypothetical protein
VRLEAKNLSPFAVKMVVVDTVDHVGSDTDSPLSLETCPRGFVTVNHASNSGNTALPPEQSYSMC